MTERLQILGMAACLFFFFASGYIDTSDADASIETARALIERGSLRAEPPTPDYHYYSRKTPCCYTKMGWVHPFLYAPLLQTVKWLRVPTSTQWQVESFLISMVNPCLTAINIVIVFMFFRTIHSYRYSATVALLLATATLLLPYSKTAHREPAQALFLALTAWLSSHQDLLRSSRLQLLFSIACIGALACKIALVVPLIPMVGFVGWRMREEKRVPRTMLAALVTGGAIGMGVSYTAFGSVWNSGYGLWVTRFDPRIWNTPLLKGVWQQTFALDSGLLIHQPWCILIPPLLWFKWKKSPHFRRFDLTLIGGSLFQLMLYAKWYSPIGVEAIGPRYLVPIVPWVIMLLRGCQLRVSKTALGLGMFLIVLSVAMNVTNASIKIQQYWTFQSRVGSPLPEPHWLVNLKFLANKLKGNPEIYALSDFGLRSSQTVSLEDVASTRGLNFWWMHWASSMHRTR